MLTGFFVQIISFVIEATNELNLIVANGIKAIPIFDLLDKLIKAVQFVALS